MDIIKTAGMKRPDNPGAYSAAEERAITGYAKVGVRGMEARGLVEPVQHIILAPPEAGEPVSRAEIRKRIVRRGGRGGQHDGTNLGNLFQPPDLYRQDGTPA